MSENLTEINTQSEDSRVEAHGTKPSAGRLKNPMTTCGFCNDNHHQSCPGGVRNGNGSIVQCSCRKIERCGSIRCTDCNNRDAGTIGTDWKCIDRNDCQAEQERSALRNPTYQRVLAVREAHGKPSATQDPTDIPASAPRPRKAPSLAGKPCTCGCGETTGGGRFKPGHDSKYLNQLTAAPGDHSRGHAYEISEAFGKKYDKRVAK